MATPEAKIYELEATPKKTTSTLNVQDSVTSKNKVQLTEQEAVKMVENFIKSPDTRKSLINLKKIEEQYQLNALPSNVKISYENAKEQIKERLQADSKAIMESLWINFDNNTPLSRILPEQADNQVNVILESPTTKQQLEEAGEVMKKYDKLNETQKTALWDVMSEIKQSLQNDLIIQNLLNKYVNNKYVNNEYKKAA